jgi:hypothetical protein
MFIKDSNHYLFCFPIGFHNDFDLSEAIQVMKEVTAAKVSPIVQ